MQRKSRFKLSVAHSNKNPYFPPPFFENDLKMAIDLLEQILPHIENAIYPQRLPLPDWRMKEGDLEGAHLASFKDKSWLPIRVPFVWGKFDKTFWFRQSLNLPHEFSGKPIVLRLDFPDALLYVNGEPYQGIDREHREVLLTPKGKSNQHFLLAVQAYSRRTREHTTFGRAELAVLNSTARGLFHALTALHELDKLFEHGSQESRDIRELIRRTLIFLKYFKPEGEEYPNAVERAYHFLLTSLETEFKSTLPVLVSLIGQSHLDVAWLWTLKETIRKCGRTFSTVLRLMEEFPEYRFSQSQPYLYELTRKEYPGIFRQITQRVAEGRWEPLGPTWVEPDCNIPSGESLVRQILYGKLYYKSHFGIEPDVFWLPDSFGFGASLPQILKKSGINSFFTTKLRWNDTNKFPHTSFWWQGIDGTRILSHIPPVGLEAQVSPKDLRAIGAPPEEQESLLMVAQTFGYGDGGGGPAKEQIEYARVLKTITGLPPSQFSTVKEFFAQLELQSQKMPVWDKELYLERHRGTFTTMGWVKKENRRSECLLYTLELLGVLSTLPVPGRKSGNKKATERKYPREELHTLWKKLLVNQFHDVISGTCIPEVYEDVRSEFQAITTRGNRLLGSLLGSFSIGGKKSANEFDFALFNPLGWNRNEYVELTVRSKEKHFVVTDSRGKELEHQLVARDKGIVRLLCHVESIPPFSFLSLTVRPGIAQAEPEKPWKASRHTVETPLYRIRLDNKGGLSSIHDKRLRRELLQKGKRGNLFQTFQDQPAEWEAWEIDPGIEKHRLELLQFKGARITEQGPLRASVRLEFRSLNGSALTQDVRLFHRSPRIDFVTHVRWNEKRTMLKVAFPLNVKTSAATYETQFGAVKRSTKPDDQWEHAKFEVPAQQWADLSEQKFGVSLLNDCKYGHDARENTLRLTLLRSPHAPHPLDPKALHDERYTDLGEHNFTYSLFPHTGDWKKGLSVRAARELNYPVLCLPEATAQTLPSFLDSPKSGIQVDSVKLAEGSDDIIVRLHEAHGETTESTLKFGFSPKSAAECDLMENELKQHKIIKGKLPLKFKPFEIKTIKLMTGKKR
ncbi:MAG: glycoside hydrolase family 38 C-terminal domain-containing protein [Bacteroidota bacterium]